MISHHLPPHTVSSFWWITPSVQTLRRRNVQWRRTSILAHLSLTPSSCGNLKRRTADPNRVVTCFTPLFGNTLQLKSHAPIPQTNMHQLSFCMALQRPTVSYSSHYNSVAKNCGIMQSTVVAPQDQHRAVTRTAVYSLSEQFRVTTCVMGLNTAAVTTGKKLCSANIPLLN